MMTDHCPLPGYTETHQNSCGGLQLVTPTLFPDIKSKMKMPMHDTKEILEAFAITLWL